MIRLIVTTLFILFLLSCSRHVVVDPKNVPSLKSTEWTIKGTPVPAGLDKKDTGLPLRPDKR